jgi:hypothetical protein
MWLKVTGRKTALSIARSPPLDDAIGLLSSSQGGLETAIDYCCVGVSEVRCGIASFAIQHQYTGFL